MLIRIAQRRFLSTLDGKLVQGLEAFATDKELFEKIKTSSILKKFVSEVSDFKYKKAGFDDAKEFKELILNRAGFKVCQDDKIISTSVAKVAEIAAASAHAQQLDIGQFREWLSKPEPEAEADETEVEVQPQEDEKEKEEMTQEIDDPTIEGMNINDIPDYEEEEVDLSQPPPTPSDPVMTSGIDTDINIELPKGMSLEGISMDPEEGYSPEPDTEQQSETLSETLSDQEISSPTEQPYFIKRDPKVVKETTPDKASIRRSMFFSGSDKFRLSQSAAKSYTIQRPLEPDITEVVDKTDSSELFEIDPEQPLDPLFMELAQVLPKAPACLSVDWARKALTSFIAIKTDPLCNRPQELSNVLRCLSMARLTNKGGADFDTTRPLNDLIDYSVFYGRSVTDDESAVLQLHESKQIPVFQPVRSKKSSFPPPSPETKENIAKLVTACETKALLTDKEWAYLYAGLTPYTGDLVSLALLQTQRSITAVEKAHNAAGGRTSSQLQLEGVNTEVKRSAPSIDTLIGFDESSPTATTNSFITENVTVSRAPAVRQTSLSALVAACQGNWSYAPTDLTKPLSMVIRGMSVYSVDESKKSELVARLKFTNGEVRMAYQQPGKQIATNYILEATWPLTKRTQTNRDKPTVRWYSNLATEGSMTWYPVSTRATVSRSTSRPAPKVSQI
eukprot:TRINITY_DN1615_c2_g1_i1.p1 TRINITY_DN1615_c2_g1~~TRINITY_DN1615_c2_g1_i1.p1  ORF type:complete len:676 (+),score=121.78 TRINITY_DN1615_c2_g1_i1:38-2065(+)